MSPPPEAKVSVVRRSAEEAERLGLQKVTEEEAREHAAKILVEWEPWTDFLFTRALPVVSIAAVTMPALNLCTAVRAAAKVNHLRSGKVIPVAPAVFLPAISLSLSYLHNMYDIMLAKTQCPVCVEVRQASMSATLGVLMPVGLSLVGSHTWASAQHARVPDVMTREYFRFLGRLVYRKRELLMGCLALQAVLGQLWVWRARAEWNNVNEELFRRQEYDKQQIRKAKELGVGIAKEPPPPPKNKLLQAIQDFVHRPRQ